MGLTSRSGTSKNWAASVAKKWKISGVPAVQKQGSLLIRGIRLLEEGRGTGFRDEHSLVLPEQPFDRQLLGCSPLFKRSRKLYLEQGGSFLATLVSSPRSLSSPILLDKKIEYSPIEREMVWAATDPIESRSSDRLFLLRTYSSSLFHEQNHRLLWDLLPSAPSTRKGLRKFLNFAESLVIVLDMALGDELGPELASLFYLTGVTYDPGTSVAQELGPKAPRRKGSAKTRGYRNYLQAALHATYLNLELYDPEDIPKAIQALFPTLGEFAGRAASRASNLDRQFIQQTNLKWQKKHHEILLEKLRIPGRRILELSDDPMDCREQYLVAEKVFDLMEL